MLVTFFEFFKYFFNIESSFIKKVIHLVLSKSLLYVLIFGRNMSKGPIFISIFVADEIFNSILSKETFLDTTILSKSILSIEIGLLY